MNWRLASISDEAHENHEITDRDAEPAEDDRPLQQIGVRDRLHLRAEGEVHHLASGDRDREGGQQRRLPHGARLQRGFVTEAAKRSEGEALETDADECAGGKHHQHDRQHGGAIQVISVESGEGADGVDLAVREVDDVQHPEDQRESDRYEGVDEADAEPIDDLLNEVDVNHRLGACGRR